MKGTTEDEVVGFHHQLNGHEFEQALGVGEGEENLTCCSSWDLKVSDKTETEMTDYSINNSRVFLSTLFYTFSSATDF